MPSAPVPESSDESISAVEAHAAVDQSEISNDNDLPPGDDQTILPVVGLGGSAGSIAALEAFFKGIAPDLGIAYVVVIHLSPDHASQLAAILQHHTSMPVIQVGGAVSIEPDTVYVIPPRRHLTMSDGKIQLSFPEQERGKRVAVDLFFRSLAATQRSRGVAIVLSGSDGDGAIGIKRMKEAGGVTIAQDPQEAEYEGMPRSAIDTGMVDWILPVAQIPKKLAEWVLNERRIELPSSAGEEWYIDEKAGETALREVLAFVHSRTGHDFAHYKRATVLRRIMRRLQVNSLENIPAYVTFLRSHPGEAAALLQDLLISVTNFFRDPESFVALEREIPAIFDQRAGSDPIRVWVPGCATGEEPYSLVMLLLEYAETFEDPPNVQVFATDLDENALRQAREGYYPLTISADVSPERLRRFFILEHGRYRVKKDVRERVLFAPHNVLSDAPFSRLHLVSCRNLMIYFNRQAQERVFAIFHFALKENGRLFLGGSESADEGQLFCVRNKKHRIYERRNIVRPALTLPAPSLAARLLHGEILSTPHARSHNPMPLPRVENPALVLARAHMKFIAETAPPSVLVGPNHEVVHISEQAGRFLHFGEGTVSFDLLSVVRRELRLELRAALFRAAQGNEDIDTPPVPVEIGGKKILVALQVRHSREKIPSGDLTGHLLVFFMETDGAEAAVLTPAPPSEIARQLEEELVQLRANQSALVEDLGGSMEELRAGNEELQALNEEHRSAVEELETSQEELQATNEELITVNQELKSKVDELSHANSDLQNLIASSDVATLFLSRDLSIKRFTPKVTEIFSIIPGDVGRAVTDLRHRFPDSSFIDEAKNVLRSLAPYEAELMTVGGKYILLRISLYRMTESEIDGVVMSFIDITASKRSAENLRLSEERYRAIFNQMSAGVAHLDLEGGIIYANRKFREMLGCSTVDAIEAVNEIFHSCNPPGTFQGLGANGAQIELEKKLLNRNGGEFWTNISVTPIRDERGKAESAVALIIDINERKRSEAALKDSQEHLQRVMASVRDFAIITIDVDGFINGWNPGAEEIFGFSEEEALGQPAAMIFTPEDRAEGIPEKEMTVARDQGHASDERWHLRKNGERFWVSGVMSPLYDHGTLKGYVKVARDLTEHRLAEAAVRESEARFRTLADAVPQLVWTNLADGGTNYFNQRWFDYSGMSYEESIGEGWRQALHPDDAAATAERWACACAQGDVFEMEFRLRRKDGEYCWFIARSIPMRDDRGNVVGWFGTATDVEKMKRAEAALRRSEESLRIALESAEMAAWDWDITNDLVTWNDRHFYLLGLPVDDRPKTSAYFSKFVHPDDRARVEKILMTALAENGAYQAEFRILRADTGEMRWMTGYGRAVEERDGRAVRITGVMYDSTERKTTEEQLQLAHDELESRVKERTQELSEALERLRYETAGKRELEAARRELLKRLVTSQEEERRRISRELHDNLGQHMVAVKFGLDTLQADVGKAGVQSMASGFEDLKEVVSSMIKATHRQAWELRPAELDHLGLEAALDHYLSDWSRRTGIEVDFRTDGSERLSPPVEIAFYRIIQEALTNVARHAEASKVTVHFDTSAATVTIEDNGRGFDPAKVSGRLGLLGMRERLALAEGELQIDSSPGKGTRILAKVGNQRSE